MFKKTKKKPEKEQEEEISVPIPARPTSGPIGDEFSEQFELEGQVNVESKETNNPYEHIMALAAKNEVERPKKFYKNNISLWTPGGIKSLAWFVNGTDDEGPAKINTKGETMMTPRTKCLCSAIGLALVFLVAVIATLAFSTSSETARSIAQSAAPTFQEVPLTPAPVTAPTPEPTVPVTTPTASSPVKEPTKTPTEEPTVSPTLFPTPPTPQPTQFNSNRCAGITDDTRWKFCFDDVTLGKCEFRNGEGRQIPGETDCLKKSDDRHFCRCPDGFLFLETFGCVTEDNVGKGCVSLAMVQAGFVLADSDEAA